MKTKKEIQAEKIAYIYERLLCRKRTVLKTEQYFDKTDIYISLSTSIFSELTHVVVRLYSDV